MTKLNQLSHRLDHALAASCVGAGPDATSTPADYRRVRRAVALARREEQRQARIANGTDRATLRAARTPAPARTPGQIRALDRYLGRD